MDSSNTGDHVAGCYLRSMHQAPDIEGSRLFQPLRCRDLTVPEKVVLPLLDSRAPACHLVPPSCPLAKPTARPLVLFLSWEPRENPLLQLLVHRTPHLRGKLTVQRPSQHLSIELSPASKSGQLS